MVSNEIVSLAFSPDGRFLLSQGGAPDWCLVNWKWETAKVLQAAQVSNQSRSAVRQCSFCPAYPTVVCVAGDGILLFFLHQYQQQFKVC